MMANFNLLDFIANHAGMNLADALKEAYEQGKRDAEPHWIPCSERLPDRPNVYTVTNTNGNVVRFAYYGTKSSREYWQRCAVAWMPLPEPYKDGE